MAVIIGGSGCRKRGILTDMISLLKMDKGRVECGLNRGFRHYGNMKWRGGYVGLPYRFEVRGFQISPRTTFRIPEN